MLLAVAAEGAAMSGDREQEIRQRLAMIRSSRDEFALDARVWIFNTAEKALAGVAETKEPT